MTVYVEMLLTAAAAVYVVDLSGFTDAWRAALARLLKIHPARLRPLPPFDCGKCAAFWACVLLALCRGSLSVGTAAFAALMSWAAPVFSEVLGCLREVLLSLPGRLADLLLRK